VDRLGKIRGLYSLVATGFHKSSKDVFIRKKNPLMIDFIDDENPVEKV